MHEKKGVQVIFQIITEVLMKITSKKNTVPENLGSGGIVSPFFCGFGMQGIGVPLFQQTTVDPDDKTALYHNQVLNLLSCIQFQQQQQSRILLTVVLGKGADVNSNFGSELAMQMLGCVGMGNPYGFNPFWGLVF